uniref:Uncharacterized protein n=1 Tax=Panagrolaimus superbus TaxID=310955 RepID=A0A914XYF5_9BILA
MDKFPNTTFLSVHPGVVPGRLYRYTNFPFRFLINSFMAPYLRKTKTAALRILDLAFTSSLQNGAYYEEGSPISVTSKIDPYLRQSLYSLIIKEVENQGFFDSNDEAEMSDIEFID